MNVRNLFIVFILLASCKKNDKVINYTPIGYFETEYTMQTGAPRQGMLVGNAKGVIILDEKYINGLNYLSSFEYIWVLYHFNEAKGWDNYVNPPESKHEFGVFATRSPRRPNPIGLSLIKLDKIEGNKLYVSNVDAFNKTPVLDIKPYLPSIDDAISIKNMEAEIYLGHHDQNFLSDSLVKTFVKGDK
jgi:tRNA-Thr(GGU) m(6)t(6)A37 methyltransferase TsaA